VLGSLTPAERGEVLAGLLVAHPELEGDAERIAKDLLSSTSTEQVAAEVEAALVWIPLDALGARAGRVRGRGYVHETDAALELVEEAIEPFRSDLERRAALGLTDAATRVAVGIVAGLYRVREPEIGTVLAYAGEDAPLELAAGVMHLAAKLAVGIPDDAAETYWPDWDDLR
jgi:hypothetical protein